GVVLTSTGTGAGNAAGSLVEAWSAGAPLLHITGEIASSYLGTGKGYIHECKDQLSMMKGSNKEAIQLKVPNQTSAVIRHAIQKAMKAPFGSVSVEIPIDYQSANIPESNILDYSSQHQTNNEVNIEKQIIDKIEKAKRVVIWVGKGIISSESSYELTQLAEMLNAAVITSQSGKGAIPENHNLCIGHFASYPEVKSFLEKSDLLLSIGVRFRGNETSNWDVKTPKEHISIDTDLYAVNRNYTATESIIGDAKEVLQSL